MLIETAGGDHFLDYGSLVEPIFAGLRRLSGLDLASTATPWAQWWMESMDGFHARRTLTKISDADVPRARVVFEVTDADGRRRRTAFAPAGGDAVPDAYVIPVAAFQALVAGLEDAGMFSQPDDQRTLADEHLAIRVGVMNQEKRLVLVPSHEDPRHGTLLARLESLEEMNVWQRYRDAKAYPDAAAWQKKMAEVFQGAAPDVRRAVLVADGRRRVRRPPERRRARGGARPARAHRRPHRRAGDDAPDLRRAGEGLRPRRGAHRRERGGPRSGARSASRWSRRSRAPAPRPRGASSARP